MSVAHFYDWAHDTALGEFMRAASWAFSACETLHFMGLCLLLGALLVIDLRILGFYRQIRIDSAMKLVPLAVAGFAINLLTGVCFFASDPFNYGTNWMFGVKMVLIVLAGINAIYHEVACKARLCGLPEGVEPDRTAKFVAASSLVLWTLVIIAGRLLPQFGIEG